MEIILKQDIPKVGAKNEIVTVKDGYARNYLIPQGLATSATLSARKQLAETLKQRAHKEERLKAEAVALAEKLTAVSLTVGAKASSTGKIFGSVTTIQLSEALAKAGFDINRKSILIKENSVKDLGKYNAIISLYKGVEVEVAFEVVGE